MKKNPSPNKNRQKKTGRSPKQSAAEKKRPVKTEKTTSALQISETRYRRLFETAQDGILILDAITGQINDVNPYLIKMLGYSHKEFLGKKLWEVSPFIDTALNKVAFKKLQDKGYIRYEDLPLETKNKEKIAVEFVSNIYTVDGKKVIQCNIREITVRKKANEKMLASENLLRELFENMSSCVAIYTARANGKDFIITDFNRAAEKTEKVDREKIIGKSVLKVFPGVKDFGLFKVFQQVWKTGKPQNHPLAFYKDKRISGWRENYVYKLPSGEIVVTYDDITERMLIEQKLRDSELKYRTLADFGQVLIWTSGLDKKCDYFNQTWLKFTGRKIEQELGDGWTKGVHPDDLKHCITIYTGAFDRRERFSMDYRLRRHDGEFRWIQDDGTPRYDSQGNFLGYIGHCLDITELKNAQEALLASEFQYRSTLNSMTDPIHVIDRNFRFVLFNDTFERWNKELGLMTDVIGKNLFEVFPFLPHKVIDEYKKVFNAGEILVTEEHSEINNRELITETRKIPILEQDKTVRVITVVRDITESKKAEDKFLQKAKQLDTLNKRLEFAMDATRTNTDIIDADFNLIYVDERWQKIYGNPEGKKCYNYFMGADKMCPACTIPKALKTKKAVVTEEVLPKENNRIIEVHTIPFQETDGTWKVFEFNIDITKHKQAEEKIRESEENFRASIDDSPLGVRISTKKAETTYANKAILDMYGYESLEELKRTPVKKRYTPQSYTGYLLRKKEREKGQRGPSDYEVSIVRKNGEVRHLRAFRKEILWNGEKQAQIIYMDITEQKNAQEKLRQSEEKFRLTFKSTSDVIFTLDAELRLNEITPSVEKVLGYEAKELTGKSLPGLNIMSPESREKASLHAKKILSGKYAPPAVYEFILKDGRTGFGEITASPIIKENKIIGVTCVSRDITERLKTEAERQGMLIALRESEEKYRTILEHIEEGYYEVDLAGNFTFFNNALCRIIGYPEEELMGMNNRRYADEENTKKLFHTFNETYRTGNTAQAFDWEIIRKDETKRYIEASVSLMRDSSGNPIGFRGTVRDITERKKAEDALRESEDKYRLIFEHSPMGLLYFDKNGVILACNDTFVKIIGSSREVLIGLNMLNLPDKGIVSAVRQALSGSTGFYEDVYQSVTAPKTTPVRALFAPMNAEGGIVQGGVGIIEDVTEQKKAQDKIKQSEEKYRSLVENAQEGVYQTAPDGKFITVNDGFARILGYNSVPELLKAVTDISNQLYVYPQDRGRLLKIVKKYGSVTNFETQLYRKDGSRVWVSLSSNAALDDQKRVLYYQGMVQDISEKKQLEFERSENVKTLRKALGATISAMAVMVETRDPYTAGHQRRVADLARAIATEMKLPSDQIDGVRMAGMLHDIGKISIPSEILTKPTQLTVLEFNLIKTHPDSGHAILKNIEFPWPIARIVLEHHERVNGSGYPRGLKENDILLESKIMAVADVVEAISSHRPYRAAHGIEAALEEIAKNKDTLYDAKAVDACLRLFREKSYTLAA